MRKILFGLGACCALAACGPAATPPGASPPSTRPIEAEAVGTSEGGYVTTTADVRVLSQQIAAPVDRVWAVLPEVYRELGIAAESDAPRRTVAGAARVSRRFMGEPASRVLDCGKGQFGTDIVSSYAIRMTVSTTVNPGTGTNARLDTAIEAHVESDGANSVAAQCRSQGRLEAMIAERVRARVGA